MCAHVGAAQARRPKVVPRPSAPRPRELGESSTQVPHGGRSPRRSTRLISRSEHALVCLVWALPCQVLSPSQIAMVQNCLSMCVMSRKAQDTQVSHGMHLASLSLVLPWSQLGKNPTFSPLSHSCLPCCILVMSDKTHAPLGILSSNPNP